MIIGVDVRGALVGAPEGCAEPDVRVSVSEALAVLRARYEAGETAAALEAVVLVGQAARLPLGGGYRHRWPELPSGWAEEDLRAALALWRGLRGAERGAELLRAARCAADVSAGLREIVGSVLDAERGAALLREASRG